jgi:hypothetical protein
MLVDHTVARGPVSRFVWLVASRLAHDVDRSLERIVAIDVP